MAALLAVLGSSGIVGLLFFFLRRYIESRLKANEEEAKKRKELRIRRMQIEDELHHSYGRLLFWLYRCIKTGEHNGELETAFVSLELVEAKKKNLDREVIADREIDGYG